jgi:cytidylate kinase
LANIINESLNVEQQQHGRYDQQYNIIINKTTAYNILVRHSLVDAEKKIIKEYKSLERKKPDELLQADITRFNGVPILTMYGR